VLLIFQWFATLHDLATRVYLAWTLIATFILLRIRFTFRGLCQYFVCDLPQ